MAPPEEIRAPESGTFTIGEPGERNSVVEETRSPEPTERPNYVRSESFLRHPDGSQPRVRHISATVAPSIQLGGRMRKVHSSNDFHDPRYNTKNSNSSKNGNMVLQLVLPSSMQNGGNVDNGNFFSASYNDTLPVNNFKRRGVRSSLASSQHDVYSTIGNGAYLNHAYSTGDLLDYRRLPGDSVPHTPMTSGSDIHLLKAPPTPPEEKKRVFRTYLTTILSCIYALFIVTLGLVIYISDVLVGNSPVAESFSLYLVAVAFSFLLYLIIDIRVFINKKNKFHSLMEKEHQVELHQSPDGEYQLNISLPEAVKVATSLPHYYCLSKGRHAGNFYLKLGAAVFCLGHLIHSGLLLGYQIVFLTSDSDGFYECTSVVTLVLDFIYPVYSFFLLYFIFKYSNVIINKNVELARFGIMHCISSSLCFWVWTIIRETMESMAGYDDEYDKDYEEAESINRMSETSFARDLDQPLALPLSSYSKRGADELKRYLNISTRVFTAYCDSDEGMSIIYQNFSPYLYPFSVEYSILVVGVLYMIWQSIGSCKSNEEASDTNHCDTPCDSDNLESNIVIHADCHSANKGIFGGIIVLVLCVVSIILFFIAISDDRYNYLAILINGATEIIVLTLMTVTAILAYRQITRLDHNTHPMSLLDDILLFICIPAFFVNAIFSIIPAVEYGNAMSIVLIILQVTQVLIQTPMIIDGLRRCSNCRELRKKKPGRELLTFLIVCNVAMWITMTFEIKSHDLEDERYEFYGKVLWSVIGHLCLPLMMFYRFHASVCIVDIWKYAYEHGGH